MSNEFVEGTDIAQALSRTLLDIVAGREVKKSKLQKQIDVSDAINRRIQTQNNMVKVMIEAKKSGINFAASMNEIRTHMKDADEYIFRVSGFMTGADE